MLCSLGELHGYSLAHINVWTFILTIQDVFDFTQFKLEI